VGLNPKIDASFVKEYTNTYNIVVNHDSQFELDEMLLLYVSFGKKISKTGKKFYHLATEYVLDKQAYAELLSNLQDDTEWLKVSDKPVEYIYKTTLEDIKFMVHELLLTQPQS
jgi:hypothetical protein